jgi:hypothetical protein
MSKTWRKLWIELYGPDGYKGSWEVTPPDGQSFDETAVRRHIADIRGKPEYRESELRVCEDEGELIIGVFTDTRPAGPAKSGDELSGLL